MKVLITAGPTREYLDDVRYLSNASSGRMGFAIAEACHRIGWEVVLVCGPVDLPPPAHCELHRVVTTSDMREACVRLFPQCDGVIATAAVCDYKPVRRVEGKMSKTGGPLTIEMIETDDVLAELGKLKSLKQWILGFALEAQNPRENALQKLRRKNCDWIVLNNPSAIGSEENSVELIAADGPVVSAWTGSKSLVATALVQWVSDQVVRNP
jgi:phosphopantothenoylcysteine decarboxylase/phosphopantothenate--cysteine ligase